MDNRAIFSIYLAGVLQGLALVAFPAASAILTAPEGFGFSNTTYGSLFIPQAFIATCTSLAGTRLVSQWGLQKMFLFGVSANIASMTLFGLCALIMNCAAASFSLLILATSCLGFGFGTLVPAINTLATLYFSAKAETAVLLMNVVLGVGTALAPLITAFFVDVGIWWGLAAIVAALLIILLLFSLPVRFIQAAKDHSEIVSLKTIPKRFWLFACASLMYGFIETLNGNWLMIYVSRMPHSSHETAAFSLALFWAMITVGRLFFAMVQRSFATSHTLVLLPITCAISLLCLAFTSSPKLATALFGMAGFGCSALLPLFISLGQKSLLSIQQSVASGIIAFYLMGYGIAAFAVGPTEALLGISLSPVFLFGSLIAASLSLLAHKLTH